MQESVAIKTVMDKLPTAELDQTLKEFVSPLTEVINRSDAGCTPGEGSSFGAARHRGR